MFKKYKFLNFTRHINAFRVIECFERIDILSGQNTNSVNIFVSVGTVVTCIYFLKPREIFLLHLTIKLRYFVITLLDIFNKLTVLFTGK